jgi:hypothetical protein
MSAAWKENRSQETPSKNNGLLKKLPDIKRIGDDKPEVWPLKLLDEALKLAAS